MDWFSLVLPGIGILHSPIGPQLSNKSLHAWSRLTDCLVEACGEETKGSMPTAPIRVQAGKDTTCQSAAGWGRVR